MSAVGEYLGFVSGVLQIVWNDFITQYWICSIPVVTFFIKKTIDLIKKVMRK